MSVDTILTEVAGLSAAERAELFDRLRDQYGQPAVPETSAELEALLAKRIADADANPGAGVPWEVVKADSLRRSRR